MNLLKVTAPDYHVLGYLVLGGKCLFFNMRFLTQLGISIAELFPYNIQFIIHNPISFVPGVGKEHPGLAVFCFAQAGTVLPLYPSRMFPFFTKIVSSTDNMLQPAQSA